MHGNEIVTARNGAVLIVTLNIPEKANALTFDMANQLFTVLKNATTDRGVRCVLLRGAGGNFMDGLDLDIFKGDLGKGLERSNQIIAPYHNAIRELQVMDKPVLAVVEGHVEGPGMSLMLASDLVIAARGTQFNCGYTNYALSPDGACSYFLPRKIGAGRAVELLMLSKPFDSETAERFGLINRIVDDAQLHDEATAWAVQLAEGPTKAYGAVKRLILQSFDGNFNAHLGLEHTFVGACSRSFDFRECLMAREAGRSAKYTGT